tara:strand:- start:129 stop:668 length:540 start_codon:yes stop_codon:yes gene_type:complete
MKNFFSFIKKKLISFIAMYIKENFEKNYKISRNLNEINIGDPINKFENNDSWSKYSIDDKKAFDNTGNAYISDEHFLKALKNLQKSEVLFDSNDENLITTIGLLDNKVYKIASQDFSKNIDQIVNFYTKLYGNPEKLSSVQYIWEDNYLRLTVSSIAPGTKVILEDIIAVNKFLFFKDE